jgi:putative pyruvate formate lyase activating enzyme
VESRLRPSLAASGGRLPRYVDLYRSGELAGRAERLVAGLASCRACPRACGVDRLSGAGSPAGGACATGRHARVSSAFPHHGEEDVLRGERGSGTIFFSQCNLHCPFCQNFDISHHGEGPELAAELLAEQMVLLQLAGCHNINLVTPSHVVPQILEALEIAIGEGLRIPIIYNSSGYDAVETLEALDGVVDVYMPDLKFASEDAAGRYLGAPDYPEAARRAIAEMHRQVGDLEIDNDGLALRGLLVRHLVMPGLLEETREVVRFLADAISPNTVLNLMAQYRPAGLVAGGRFAPIARRPRPDEVSAAFRLARRAGLHRFA